MFIAILTYKKPLEEVDCYLQAHRDYLMEHYAAGDFIASGPQTPRVGGVIMIKAESRHDVDSIIAQDPFNINDIADYQIVEFTPTMSCEPGLSEEDDRPPLEYSDADRTFSIILEITSDSLMACNNNFSGKDDNPLILDTSNPDFPSLFSKLFASMDTIQINRLGTSYICGRRCY